MPVTARRDLWKVYDTTRKGKGDLNCMVSVKARRFAGQADPKAASAPHQNASGCRYFHGTPAAKIEASSVASHAIGAQRGNDRTRSRGSRMFALT